MQRYFPGDYQVILPGASVSEPLPLHDPLEIFLSAQEERSALRLFLRALRAIPEGVEWRATVWSPRPLTAPATISRRLRERVEFVDAERMPESEALMRADVVVLASDGVRPIPARWCARWPAAWCRSPRA